jgi:hypothetical protein
MLSQIESFRPDVDTLIAFVGDELLRYYMQGVFERAYKVDKNYIVQVETAKQLEKAKSDAMLAPMTGLRWLVLVDLDKVPVVDFEKNLMRGNDNCFTFAFTRKYANYKRCLDMRALKAGTQRVMTMYLGNLRSEDIYYLHKHIVPDGYSLTDDVLNYLCKHYCWDVPKVMLLLTSLSRGSLVRTKEELISMVGLGGVTIDSVVIDLLRVEPVTGKKRNNVMKKYLMLFKDLSNKFSYSAIYNGMKQSMLDILTFKMLVLRGDITNMLKIIPKGFDLKRIQRLKRFEKVIKEEVSLNRVLTLLGVVREVDNFEASLKTMTDDSGIDAEYKLMTILYKFVSLWEVT